MNASSPRMRSEIIDVIRKVREDDEVTVLILTGAGDLAFYADADVSAFREFTRSSRV